jgi:hypothetical protein
MKTSRLQKTIISGMCAFALMVPSLEVYAGFKPCVQNASGQTASVITYGSSQSLPVRIQQATIFLNTRGITFTSARSANDGTNNLLITTTSGHRLLVLFESDGIIIGTINLPN